MRERKRPGPSRMKRQARNLPQRHHNVNRRQNNVQEFKNIEENRYPV